LGKEEARMKIRVTAIFVPAGSTIGLGRGVPEGDDTKVVEFAGDWRSMAELALMASAAEDDGEQLVVEIPDWSVLAVRELP
jgi:hypothetical protein